MSESPDSDFIDNVKRRDAAERLLEKANTPAQQPRSRTNGSSPGGYAQQGLRNEVDELRKLAGTTGTRQTQLNTASFNVGQLIQPDGITFDDAKRELTDAALYIGLKRSELKAWDLPDRGLRDGMAKLRDLSDKMTETSMNSTLYVVPSTPPPPALSFTDVEDGFWTSRSSLETIYLAALSRMCAPWSVLACCCARALYGVRPHVTLPDIIGGPGSLNWFGAITANSGGGKGAASATAKLLVNAPVQQRNTGSGEGIIRAYVRPKQGETPAGMHEALMFMVDEIDSLTAQSKRSGATTMSVLRSAFSGETLGFSYVNNNTPVIDAHTYRMTMVISVQPTRAAELLADVGGGTPQRFMWFPGTDTRISADYAGGFVESLSLPKPGEWQYPMTIQIPDSARDLILRERVKAMRGNVDALDGHALFVREKFAFALAVLDGRAAVTEEDWELSGIAARVSDVTREWVAAQVAEAKDDEATEKGRLQGVSSLAANEERDWRTDQKRARITALVVKHIKTAGQQGLSDRTLTNKIAARDRVWLNPILNRLLDEDAVRFDDDEKRWYISD